MKALLLSTSLFLMAGAAVADDKSDVLAANNEYLRAFSSLDIKAVEAVWAHDGNVTVIHPFSKTPAVGWDAVRKSWEEAISRSIEFSITMDNPHVSVGNNAAWVVGIENVRAHRKSGQTEEFSSLATNIYEKRDGRWLMVHHHGSRMPQ